MGACQPAFLQPRRSRDAPAVGKPTMPANPPAHHRGRACARCDDRPFRVVPGVDWDGNGKLSKKEVVEALKAQLPVDYRQLDAEIDDPRSPFNSYWKKWDRDGSGTIEPGEVVQIAGIVRRHYRQSSSRRLVRD